MTMTIEQRDGTAKLAPEAAEHRLRAPIAPTLVAGLVGLLDAAMMITTGIAAHLVLVLLALHPLDSRYAVAAVFGAAVMLPVGRRRGLYTDGCIFHQSLPARPLLLTVGISFLMLLALAFILKVSSDYSRLWLGLWMALAITGLAVGRLATGYRLRRLTAEGRLQVRVVIVGAGEHGQRLAQHLRCHGDARTRVVGFIDDRLTRIPVQPCGLTVLGDVAHLIRLIRLGQVDEVYLALPWQAQARLTRLIERLAITPVHIRLGPDLIGFQLGSSTFSRVAGLPMLKVFDRPISGWAHVAKRAEDVLVAGLAVLMLAPVMAATALAIKLDSPGPVFFRQRRQGFNDTLFEVWKFRTMYVDQADADCTVQTRKADPRVTRVGAFLRKSSVDELPQLINVLRGDMSIVGPRPHALSTKAEGRLFQDVVHKYAARHRVKPGITGWAQVNGWRGETDTIAKIERRVDCDLYYIDHWSLGFDLLIILKTALAVLKRDNAY